jgi:hypothetical protein
MVNYFDRLHIEKVFGNFKVVEISKSHFSGNAIWAMECLICHNIVHILPRNIFMGYEIECGCGNSYRYEGEAKVINEDIQLKNNFNNNENNDGWTFTNKDRQRLRKIRQVLINRCYNEKYTSYHLYGGNGITVSNNWLKSLDNFIDWSIKNGYRPWLNLKRKNKKGNYTEDNCYWGSVDNIDNSKIGKDDFVDYLNMGIDIDKLIDDINNHVIDIKTAKESMEILKSIVNGKLIDDKESEKIMKYINKNIQKCYEVINNVQKLIKAYNYATNRKGIYAINNSMNKLNKIIYDLTTIMSSFNN